MYHIFIIHLLAGGHLGCLRSLAIVNRAAVNTAAQVSLEWAIKVFSICQVVLE